jgi:hypothetical protein
MARFNGLEILDFGPYSPVLYHLSYLPAHSCTYVTITHSAHPVNGFLVERGVLVPRVPSA